MFFLKRFFQMKLKTLFAQVSEAGNQIRNIALDIKDAFMRTQVVGAILDIRDAIILKVDSATKNQEEFNARLENIGLAKASGMTKEELKIALYGRSGTLTHYRNKKEADTAARPRRRPF
jgi:hypothetical protein